MSLTPREQMPTAIPTRPPTGPPHPAQLHPLVSLSFPSFLWCSCPWLPAQLSSRWSSPPCGVPMANPGELAAIVQCSQQAGALGPCTASPARPPRPSGTGSDGRPRVASQSPSSTVKALGQTRTPVPDTAAPSTFCARTPHGRTEYT